jgi:FkbM family methyltransferase
MNMMSNWRGGTAAETLRRRRFVFVDIGARAGLPLYWKQMGSLLDAVAFEPDPVEATRLADAFRKDGAVADVVQSAVWDAPGQHTLHITRSPGCSSLYSPNLKFLGAFPDAGRFDVVREVEVTAVRLDSLMPDPVARPFRFVKIDAQGGALKILEGAPTVLQSAIGLEIEVELAPMYDDEPLFGDVDKFLRQQGYELVDLRPTYWRRDAARHIAGFRGQPVFCDTLYLWSPQVFAGQVAAATPEGAAHLCASALLICDVYGLTDWIASYAAALPASQDAARRMLLDGLSTRGRSSGPGFPMRFQLGLWLKDVADWLIETRDIWAVPEMRLGSKPRLGRRLVARLADRMSGRG